MNPQLSPELAWTLAFTIAALAGVIRGYAGFGSSMMMSPVMALVFGPAQGVALLSILEMMASIHLLPKVLPHTQWRSLVLPMYSTAMVGIPLGVLLLLWVQPEIMRQVIGLVVVTFTSLMIVGVRFKGAPSRGGILGIGFLGGLSGGATGAGGPPIVLYFLSRPLDAQTYRANMVSYFTLTNMTSIAVLAWHQVYHWGMWSWLWKLALVFFVGINVGMWLFFRLDPKRFRPIILSFLLVVGLFGLLYKP